MPLTLNDTQKENLAKLGIKEGDTKWRGLDINYSGGNFSLDGSQKVDTTQKEIDTFTKAYQTSTARRSKTDERMTDFENYSNQEDEEFQRDTGGDTKDTGDETRNDGTTDKDLELGNAGITAQIDAANAQAEEDIAYINNSLDRLANQADGAYRRLVSATKQLYGARIDEMRKANDTLLKKQNQIGMRTGRQRYTPLMQQGILTAEEQAGTERIAKLQAQLMYDLAQAEQGKQKNDLKLFNDAYDKIEARKEQLNKEIADLYKAATDENEARRKSASEQRLLEKQEYEQAREKAQDSAPYLAEVFNGLTSEEEQAQYLTKTAGILGLEPVVLAGIIEEGMTDAEKAQADLDRVIQLTNTGYASNAREEEKMSFDPTSDQQAKVGRFLQSEAGRTQFSDGIPLTTAEIQELMRDPELFFAILDEAEKAGDEDI